VVVVTGASAGVGRAVVRAFAARGDRIALIARGEAGLEAAAAEAGGLAVRADVADPAQLEEAARRVERELGPIDVWVNNAFAGVLAPFHEITPEEFARATHVTYLGTVNGTRVALERMLPRDHGVIVQVGSALAYRGIPLQSAYCGAKHAIKGFTESVRAELRHEGSAVLVTMVQLPALNTPQFDWMLSRMPRRAQPVPPIYQPEVAADAVVRAADLPRRRQRLVGFSTVGTLLAEKIAPGLLDRYLARTGYDAQQTEEREPPHRPGNLWQPRDADHDHGAHGRFDDTARTPRRPRVRRLVAAGGKLRKRPGPAKQAPEDVELARLTTVAGGLRMTGWHRTPRQPAPTVVCVHGAGVSSRTLHPLVAELGETVDAWTVDLPGFGHSDKPRRPLTTPELATALAAWLRSADLAPACLVGCSYGCQIAVDAALRHPDAVSALVLVGPTMDPSARTWPRMLARWLRNAVHEDPRMLPLNIADYRDAGAARVLATLRESARDRVEDRLPRVRVPTLVVRGELDRIGPPAWAERVARLVPDGRLVTIPGAPHMVPFRAPRELSDVITGFVTTTAHVVG
jgi:NAD(P)-dependent dehydrogenase (short-subunit alcohol dehydrogenase family)/pimeloyl-ACP methyl ester carboxylesterase